MEILMNTGNQEFKRQKFNEMVVCLAREPSENLNLIAAAVVT